MSLFRATPRPAAPDTERANLYPGQSNAAVVMYETWGGSSDREPILPTFRSYAVDGYQANGIIFSTILARLMLFSEAEFKWQSLTDDRLYGDQRLALLEKPWPGGSTGELLARMEQDVSLAGNAFIRNIDDEELLRLRPDLVTIVSGITTDRLGREYRRLLGYGWRNEAGGIEYFDRDEIAHWSPIPDPLANFRGMSWLTPVVREIDADTDLTRYKTKYLQNAATPNLLVTHPEDLDKDTVNDLRDRLQARYGGIDNAFKTLVLDGGADATIIGSNFEQLNLAVVQAAGENRIAVAGGVPAIVVGLKEGLEAATYCLPGDEPVWAQTGPKPIRDVGVGDLVWSHVDGGLALRRVTWQARVGEKRVYTIRTRNRVLRATGNHPVLVRVPGTSKVGPNHSRHPSTEWRKVEDLRPGDKVVQVQYLPDSIGGYHLPTGEDATPEVMQWLGAYLGDGSGTGGKRPGTISMAIPSADRARDFYEKLTAKVFPGVRIGHEPRSFRFTRASVVRWLVDIGFGGTAKTKRVPGWVFSLRRDLRLAFLAGLVDTDGSIDKRGTLKIQLANRPLAEDVKMLLVGCGVQTSNLYEQTFKADVLPNPGIHAEYRSWAITSSSADEVAQIPFDDWLYRERVESNTGRRRAGGGDSAKAGLDDTLGFFTVRSIDVGESEPVYDIQVDEGASFVASGVVVHNSNYGLAMRRFADITMRPNWRTACSALETIVPPSIDSRLWFDPAKIAALREGEKERAEIASSKAAALESLVRSGWEPASAAAAMEHGDFSKMIHTGLVSVQLQPPGTAPTPTGTTPTGAN